MVALATVLSIIKIVEMPYGGSVSLASALPIVIIAYRHGLFWGLSSGLVYSVLQQLLGLNNLSYVTGWQSVVAVIFLDYLLAFTVFGLSGIFSKKAKNQHTGMVLGALLASFLRYACHVIAGATVWAGLSIPSSAALGYSFIYNATYMIPDTCVLLVAVYFIATAIDFSRPLPVRASFKNVKNRNTGTYITLALFVFAVVITLDVGMVFPYLQDAESGVFTLANLSSVNWLVFTIVNLVATLAILAFGLLSRLQHSENR